MELAEVQSIIYSTMRDELLIPADDVGLDDPLHKLYVDTDDWTFCFIPEVVRRLKVEVPVEEWSTTNTVREMAVMLQKYLLAKEADRA